MNLVLNSKIPDMSNIKSCLRTKWASAVELSMTKPMKAQIWVKIWGVPLSLYRPTGGLSYISSAIGRPRLLKKPHNRELALILLECEWK
ncbi:hypothetical protein SLE2022_312010 [Rubroshorea leprosula]